MPTLGVEHEDPQHAGDRRRHGVGPDQEGLVEAGAADDAVGHHRQQQRDRETEEGRRAVLNTTVTRTE